MKIKITEQIKVTEYEIRYDVFRWRICFNKRLRTQFCQISVFEIIAFQNLYLKIFDEKHKLQHSQCRLSMANINLYESRNGAFFDSSHRFRDVSISNFVTLKMQVKVTIQNNRKYRYSSEQQNWKRKHNFSELFCHMQVQPIWLMRSSLSTSVQLFERLRVRFPLPDWQFSARFNSLPIVPSPYCAT